MLAAFNVTALQDFGYPETTRFIDPMESRYRAGAEQGRLDLAFTWREDQLLVTGISLDPDA